MHREAPSVTLQPFRASHLPILAAWLHEPHVRRWYGEPDEYLAWAGKPPAGGAQAIIAAGASEVGYIRWHRVGRDTLDALGLHEIPTNSVDVDILLGAGEVGLGVGPAALSALVAEIRRDPGVPLIGLTTGLENYRAHRAFEKAGFRIVRQYHNGSLGLCHLMILDLRDQPDRKPGRGGRQ